VAAQAVGPSGRVVGVDLQPLQPPIEIENTIAFIGDFTQADVLERILAEIGGPADVLLSDAAPKLSGVRATDRAREEALLEAVEASVPRLLRRGGTLVAKLLDCPEAEAIAARLRERFASARTVRLRATRQGSTERYLLGRDFRA